jgi:hypothetical protein
MNPKTEKIVIVTGDVTMDWNLMRIRRSRDSHGRWDSENTTRACWQRGGAYLLADLIAAVAESSQRSGQASFSLRQTATPLRPVGPQDPHFHHSYAIWSEFKSDNKTAWRVEEFLGMDRTPEGTGEGDDEGKRILEDTPQVDLLVVDDANLGFRDHPEIWPAVLKAEGQRPWILLKMAQPVAQGRLWEHLLEKFADRLMVVMTVDDLRRMVVQITGAFLGAHCAGCGLELVHNPRVDGMARCANVIVSFDTAGTILLSRLRPKGRVSKGMAALDRYLIFDPQLIEGMWDQSHPGGMIGFTTCLTAGIARQLMLSPGQPDVQQGIQSGLAAMRRLHLEGYRLGGSAQKPYLAFPIESVAEELARESAPFAVAEIQDPVRFLTQPLSGGEKPPEGGFWTILHDYYRENLDQVCEQIVVEGADAALQGVPLGVFGDLLTVDRQEIGFTQYRIAGREYRQEQQKRPLSIAVFGAPGSGKSFGITQVAKSLAPGRCRCLNSIFLNSRWLTVIDALHRVRDVAPVG